MRCTHWMLLLAFVAAVAAGCGGSDGSDESSTPGDARMQTGAGPVEGEQARTASGESVGPAEAVAQFLDAVRRGDDEAAAVMFTPLAREKAAEMNIQVAPRGSDTARFEVGKVEYVRQDLARVESVWTDLDQDGGLRTDEMAWMLRREPEGWRVAGMAATVFQGEPPLLLNFENPQETLRKLDSLREEIRRRSEAENLQAQQPENSADSIRR